jgi:hypothetical protein
MQRIWLGSAIVALAVGGVGLFFWPRSPLNAQVSTQLNAEGCTCSRPTLLGSAREQLSVYYCACPGAQCVITATAAGTSVPPNLAQTCRTDTQVLGPR